jgi:hypothetical protein
MKALVKIEKEVEIKTLEVAANVRYWEDSEINGVDDEMGDLTPFRKGDLWCPIIDIDSGIIKDWPQGTIASIHFKICDSGSYFLKDETGNTVLSIERDYVPSILCPKDNGYGDYIIMDINEGGQIQNWKADISSFQPED